MFIHIGNEVMVPLCDIVAIIDVEISPSKNSYRQDNSNKSAVIIKNQGRNKVHYSNISTSTLYKRVNQYV